MITSTHAAAPDPATFTGHRDRALLNLAIQTGLRISEVTALTTSDVHLDTGPHVTCTGKGRRNRATPLTSTTVAVLTGYLAERASRPGPALFSGPRGQRLSGHALERRLAVHLAAAARACPSLTGRHVTMHTMRHTAAMNLLHAGVDIAVIALWLGHPNTASTDAYLTPTWPSSRPRSTAPSALTPNPAPTRRACRPRLAGRALIMPTPQA